MQLEFEPRQDTLVVSVFGELDMLVADRFRAAVDARLEEGYRNLVLDLSGVTFVDSSGLGVILGRFRRLNPAGGRMAIVGARPPVRRVLELSGLMRVMGIYRDRGQAVAELAGPAAAGGQAGTGGGLS